MKTFKFLMLFIVLAISCDVDNSDDVVVANAVVNDDNVMRATINGEIFESIDNNTSSNFINDTTLRLVAGNEVSNFEFIIKQFDGVGFYEFTTAGSETGVEASYTVLGIDGQTVQQWTAVIDPDDPQEVIVTGVTENSIEGTFIFTMNNPNLEDNLEVSGGTFKIML